jgi:hypothetical protein
VSAAGILHVANSARVVTCLLRAQIIDVTVRGRADREFHQSLLPYS